jgi:hypothetical protein
MSLDKLYLKDSKSDLGVLQLLPLPQRKLTAGPLAKRRKMLASFLQRQPSFFKTILKSTILTLLQMGILISAPK